MGGGSETVAMVINGRERQGIAFASLKNAGLAVQLALGEKPDGFG